jgi:hypothetical protein
LNIVLVTALFFALISYLERRTPWARSHVFLIIFVPIVLVCFNRLLIVAVWNRIFRQIHEMRYKQSIAPILGEPASLRVIFCCALVWIALILIIWKFAPRLFHFILAAAKIASLSAAVLGIVLLADLTIAGVRRSGDTRFAPMFAQTAAEHTTHPRIVWLVLDELSYKQAFETRIPDLNLPNFDHLRAESNLYTNARPIGLYTDLAVPGMLLGEQLDWLRYALPNRLSYIYDSDKKTHLWDPNNTVLGDAERARWNVGLVGWWNPYCTMFSGVLQQCFWTFGTPYNPMRPWFSVGHNMSLAYTDRFRRYPGPPLLQLRQDENSVLLEKGKVALADDRLDFVMVHLGMPHHPYVFDRHTGKFTTEAGHSYQDGLAMTDRALGEMLPIIESNPRWANTTLIVQGDHSWRTEIWTVEPGWTPEDEKTSNGRKFDDRPLLLVHAPGQSTPGTVTESTSLLKVHALLESAIHSVAPSR